VDALEKQGGFDDLVRRLELSLVGPGLAKGRWRRRVVTLEASGRIRVALGDELPVETDAELALPAVPSPESEDLSVRSASPGTLVTAVARPKVTGALFKLLAFGGKLEVSDHALALQLEALGELARIKDVLDQAVAAAAVLSRTLGKAKPRDPFASEPPEPVEVLSPDQIARYRREFAANRRWIFLFLAALVLGTLSFPLVLHDPGPEALAMMAVIGAFAGLAVHPRDVACPSCGFRHLIFVRRRECPRCGVLLEVE
jgi:hypothetical protein